MFLSALAVLSCLFLTACSRECLSFLSLSRVVGTGISCFVLQIHNRRTKFQDTSFDKETFGPVFIKVVKNFRSYFYA